MSTIPAKVGRTISEKFICVDASNAAYTGKVQADFTVKISNGTTGNVSTTGLTITEVSAANDPGHYAVSISGTTGFHASTTGEYTVEIYLTADIGTRVAMTFLVTANGDFDGTSGSASFTATAANGRVTDGSAALASATVRIRSSATYIYTTTTTDSSGLWGPIYFDASGTYYIDVQKSGYTANSAATITVSGTTATLSPATDIALSSVTSGTGLTASDLWAYARRMSRNKNGTQSDTEIKQAVNDALDMVAMESEWPWLYTDRGVFSLDGAYTTGTLTFTNGSPNVTIGGGGTWPTWAASGKLLYNGKIYFVSSRTSSSVIVLTANWKEATATGVAYTALFRDEYSLASDVMKFGALHPGQTWVWGGDPMPFEKFLQWQNDTNWAQNYPYGWTIASGKIRMWPYPSQDLLVNYSYYKKPAALSSSSDEADWDPTQVILLRRAIDYQVALRYEDCVAGTPKQCMDNYQDQLTKSKVNNKNPMLLPPVGYNRDRRRVNPGDFILPANT